nr:hypothetical protein SYMBAF_160280 [Serratia symbiotica]
MYAHVGFSFEFFELKFILTLGIAQKKWIYL